MPFRPLVVASLSALIVGTTGAAAAAESLPPAVASVLHKTGLPLGSFGIAVQSVDDPGRAPWVSLNAEQPFLMASTTKLVTSLAALDLLGPTHRWVTEAHGNGALVGGRLGGDLVIDGGEVGLTATELRRWFRQMRAEGLSDVGGNIVLRRVSLLHAADPAQARATTEELIPDAPPEAKAYNHGKLLVTVKAARGDRAEVMVRPRPVNMRIVNDVLTGGGQCNAWARWKSPDETRNGPPLQLWVRGRWDASCGSDNIAFVNPPADARFAPEFSTARVAAVAAPQMVAKLWAEAGGRLRGRVVETQVPPSNKLFVAAGRNWSSEVQTPLPEVMREMNKTSNNAAAHSLLLSLGSEPPPQGGVLQSAISRVRSWLRRQGLADGDINVEEGSGRSRAERGKPSAMVRLLCNAWTGPGAQAFIESLPIAGVDGTLVNRMRHGSATGQAFLKTGTLSDTRALAGYVRAKSGKVYAVAAIVTHPSAAKGTPALDALIEWVANEG